MCLINLVNGCNSNHQDQPQQISSSSSSTTTDIPTPNFNQNYRNDRSPLHRLTTSSSSSSGVSGSNGAPGVAVSFQYEISKAIEEKFGPNNSNSTSNNNNMVVRLPQLEHTQHLQHDQPRDGNLLDGSLPTSHKSHLPPIPESASAGINADMSGFFPAKSPKIANR